MSYTIGLSFAIDDGAFAQDVDEITDNIVAIARAALEKDLGGSKNIGSELLATVQDAPEWRDVWIDGTQIAGFTVEAEIFCRTSVAATTITPKVRNITAASDAGVGVACSVVDTDYEGANQQQTITLTIATGLNRYRLQLTNDDANNPTFADAKIRIFANT